MATEPATINLDDIFGAIPNLETSTHVDVAPTRHDSFHHRTESVHRADSHAGSHHVSHVSSAVYASHVSSGYTPTPESVLDVYIPPEPRTRASTAQHSSQVPRSQATSVSTVRNEHSHVPVSHVMVHPVPAPREPSYAPSDNGLMDSIFGVVSLPEVQYNSSAPSSHVSHHHHHHNNVHHGDHHVAIQHIDDALAGEDTDGHSVASEQSYRAPSQASKHSQYSAHHGAHIVANNVVNDSFNALNLNGSANGHHELYEYQDEIHDRFEPAHLPYPQVKEQGHRPRALTLDSMASAAETRYGGFDVHDDHDHYTGQEIDLHHNEVAYNRPKKIAVKSQPIAPMQSSAPYSGGTYKLQQLNREVADAHKKQAQLAAQIERMEVENERRRQQNLAKEAQLKVENRFGYNQRSSSVTSQSSTGHVGSGHRHSSSSAVPLSSHISHQNGHHNHSRSSTVTTTVTPAKLVSQTSIYEEEPTTISEVAQYQISHGHSLGRVGKFNLVVPHMETVQGYSKNTKIHKVVIGGHSLPTEDDKCVLLFGPVGSGKTSTLNSMLNYLYDVKKENDFRFVLDHDHKKTVGLTAYVINNSILPFSVTVIDTPGVIDEKGNKTVSNLIKAWFEQELFDAGAFRLDAISIVLKHDEDNLGWPFIYELATVKRMFGDDLKTNVLPIITHTEPLPQPLAIRSLALANIAFVEYYKVNNIGFVPEAKGITKLQHNLFFTHGMASLERFFRGLQELIHPLLAVLRSPAGLRSVQSHSYEGTALY